MLKKSFHDLSADAKTRIRETTPEEVRRRIEEPNRDWVLIDVREQDEYRGGHLPGALGCGRGILEFHIADLVPETDREIVLYCRGGHRSALSADSLREMGYTNVLSMSGGFREWAAKGYPVSDEDRMIEH
jgi:rhodanese-related sulfurtransferase